MKKLIVVSALVFCSLGLNASGNYRKVLVGCQNPGSHQDVAKTPIITNTTGHAISALTKVYWTATDGDKGYVQGPFAINESKTALGAPGNGYSCEAYYTVRLP